MFNSKEDFPSCSGTLPLPIVNKPEGCFSNKPVKMKTNP